MPSASTSAGSSSNGAKTQRRKPQWIIGAAISSFVSFALGALVPLVPFMAGAGERAFGFAAAAAALSLFIVGMATSQLTGQPLLRGGLRLLVVGGGAGIVAYLIGKLLGVSV